MTRGKYPKGDRKCKRSDSNAYAEDDLETSKFMNPFDPDLNRNAKNYGYNHKYKDVVEITLHFINIKY